MTEHYFNKLSLETQLLDTAQMSKMGSDDVSMMCHVTKYWAVIGVENSENSVT